MAKCRKSSDRRPPLRKRSLHLEQLEDRSVPSTAAFQHVLILSVDGLHQADIADPFLAADLTNIQALQSTGVTYTNASTARPTDSFPGTLSYLTGALPGTTGVFYDDSYSRTLFAPGSTTPGTEVLFDESIDKDPTLLNGGGDFTPNSINPAALPVDAHGSPVYPHQFVNVNTIFNVAHDAGLHTAFSDKHPGGYDIANGHNGGGVDDFYSPEIAANAALLDPMTNLTVNADVLLAMNPYTDVSKYQLVDASTDPLGPGDPNLESITHNVLLTERYDDLKVQAILNEIHGKNSLGNLTEPVPALFAMNFQAVSVAQKYFAGGVVFEPSLGQAIPSEILKAAVLHTDASVGKIVAALQAQGLWDETELILAAKHGQNPRVGVGGLMADSTLPNVLSSAGVGVAQATQDDVSLIWLQDQAQTSAAVTALKSFRASGQIRVFFDGAETVLPANQVIDKIIYGPKLQDFGLGDPTANDRTPDIIVTLKTGFIWVGNPKKFTFKRAEHGGFSSDDTHVVLIVGSGGLEPSDQGRVVNKAVTTTQIAVTTLKSLGLNAGKLQGAVAEGTKELPGLHLDQIVADKEAANSVLQNINHFIIIYQENWSFDSLYPFFPGANNLLNAVDANGNPHIPQSNTGNGILGKPLLPIPKPIDNSGNPDPRFPDPSVSNDLYAIPYDLLNDFGLPLNAKTGDIVHRFWHEKAQIDGGLMDQFAGWSDNPGLVLSYFDANDLPEGQLAQQYVMADNFFHAAYGGSFLNHQFLVAAGAPVFPNAASITPSSFPTLDPVTGQLALQGNGKIVHDGKITPIGTFGDQSFSQNYAVNTIFSQNLVPTFKKPTDADLLPSINDSNPNDPTRPFMQNIGDLMDAAGVSWKWYSGGWDQALKAAADRNPAEVAPDFQWHHQPFAYYDNFAPNSPGGKAHLQDEINFFDDLQNGTLPKVSFVKPLGPDNEHPGYANLLMGQQHVADIVHAVQNSPEWAHTAIIITYDENGGRWDHVAPPTRDQWGDGTRVPTIIISPYAKQGYVAHQQYDTLSILSTIEDRFHLPFLNQADADATNLRDAFQATAHASVGRAYLQKDAYNLGLNTLVVLGTEARDDIHLSVSTDGTQVIVQLSARDPGRQFPLAQISRIQVYGQGGNDRIIIDPNVVLPAQIFAGSGNNHIQTGNGNTVVVGGKGNNTIDGGSGRNILIGGLGRSVINGHDGAAILIAGTTKYGQDAEALQALANEWTTPGETVAQQVVNLQAGVSLAEQTFKLDSTTVFSNGRHNTLTGGSGLDWYFANLVNDDLHNVFGQDLISALA